MTDEPGRGREKPGRKICAEEKKGGIHTGGPQKKNQPGQEAREKTEGTRGSGLIPPG